MELKNSDAYSLVKAALEANAIKLGGPSSAGTPEQAGENDAKYLMALLDALVKQPAR